MVKVSHWNAIAPPIKLGKKFHHGLPSFPGFPGSHGADGQDLADGRPDNVREDEVAQWLQNASPAMVSLTMQKTLDASVMQTFAGPPKQRSWAEALKMKVPMKHKLLKPGPVAAAEAFSAFTSKSSNGSQKERTVDVSKPIVGFSSCTYYCLERNGKCDIDVMRLGPLDQESSVNYRTHDGSGRAGFSYKPDAGVVRFLEGQEKVTIQANTLDNNRWTEDVDFFIELQCERRQNCNLDEYLRACRVMVINDEPFPSRRHQALIESEQYDKIWTPSLVWDIFKNIVPRTRVTFMFAASRFLVYHYNNVMLMWDLFSKILFLDFVLSPTKAGPASKLTWLQSERSRIAFLSQLVALNVAVFLLKHIISIGQYYYGSGGAAKMHLQRAMLHRFLNYTNESRNLITRADLVLAIHQDAHAVVDEGILAILKVSEKLAAIILLNLFVILAPAIFGNEIQYPVIILASLVYPLAYVFLIVVRRNNQALKRLPEAEIEVTNEIRKIFVNLRLIIDYRAQLFFLKLYKDASKVLHDIHLDLQAMVLNNQKYPEWITVLATSAYVVFGSALVLQGDLSLGIFTTSIEALAKVGECWSALYGELLELELKFVEVQTVTSMLNMPIESFQRNKLLSYNLKETAKRRQDMHHPFDVDMLTIDLKSVHLVDRFRRKMTINGNAYFKQGELSAIVSKPGGGKTTALKVLVGRLLPVWLDSDHPGVFIPSQLRVLHVDFEPMFLQGTLLFNLTLGTKEGTNDGDLERVKRICRRLELDDELVALLDSQFEDRNTPNWIQVLSQSQAYLCSLGRALVANPEVICVHKPVMPYDAVTARIVMKVLREHVDNRGLEKPAGTRAMRRPRTVIFTSLVGSDVSDLDYADAVFHVSREEGIKQSKDHRFRPPNPGGVVASAAESAAVAIDMVARSAVTVPSLPN